MDHKTTIKDLKTRLLIEQQPGLLVSSFHGNNIFLVFVSIRLTVTLETLGVAIEPGSTVRSSLDTIGTVSTLAKTT